MYVSYRTVNVCGRSMLRIVPFGERVVLSEDWPRCED